MSSLQNNHISKVETAAMVVLTQNKRACFLLKVLLIGLELSTFDLLKNSCFPVQTTYLCVLGVSTSSYSDADSFPTVVIVFTCVCSRRLRLKILIQITGWMSIMKICHQNFMMGAKE